MDKMRQDFERWACNYNLNKSDFGNYADRVVNVMWKSWKASREAMEVELPESCCGHAVTVDELRDILKAHGIALKVCE